MIILKHSVGIDSKMICEKAFNGVEALNMIVAIVEKNQFRCCDFDLILMDCNMPGMDGFETTLKIREYLYSKGADQPIISAVTGHMEQMYID